MFYILELLQQLNSIKLKQKQIKIIINIVIDLNELRRHFLCLNNLNENLYEKKVLLKYYLTYMYYLQIKKSIDN